MVRPNVFDVKHTLVLFGFWYALHRYGFGNLWTIFVAHKMNQREDKPMIPMKAIRIR